MEPQSFHPLDYLSVVNRRKWWFILPLVAVHRARGAVAVTVWPKTYMSKATIGMQSPTLSPDLLRGRELDGPGRTPARDPAVAAQPDRPGAGHPRGADQPVASRRPTSPLWLRDNLARNIEVPPPIGLNGRPDPTRGIDLFYIGYTDRDPHRAQRIANRVAVGVRRGELEVPDRLARRTPPTCSSSRSTASQATAERTSRTRLRTKKQNFVGSLPEQIGANVQMVNGARSQFESISMQIRAEQDRLSMIESQLDQMKQGVGAEAMTSAATVAGAGGAEAGRRPGARSWPRDRALGYTDKHPEIERLQREIKQAARRSRRPSKVPSADEPRRDAEGRSALPREAPGARHGAAAHPRAAGGVRLSPAPDWRVPEPRRGGPGRRAGARLARARVQALEKTRYTRPDDAVATTRVSPRTWRASRGASGSASSTRPTSPTRRSSRSRCKHHGDGDRRRPRAWRRRRARPRVPRSVGARLARAAERIRSAGPRRDSADHA